MALEIVTDAKNDKTEFLFSRNIKYIQQENTGRDICLVLCPAFICINR